MLSFLAPHVKWNLNFCKKFRCLYYSYDTKSNSIATLKILKNIVIVRLLMVFNLIHLLLQFLSIITSHNATRTEKLEGYLLIVPYLAMLLLRWEWSPDQDIVILQNFLFFPPKSNDIQGNFWIYLVFPLFSRIGLGLQLGYNLFLAV